jgi:hypothetical protein
MIPVMQNQLEAPTFPPLESLRQRHTWLGGEPIRRLQTYIVVAVILMSGLIPIMSTTLQLAAVAVVIGVVGLLVLLRWPSLGLVILLYANMGLAVEISTGSASSLNISVLMVAGLIVMWLIESVALHRRIQFVESRTVLPLIAFIVSAVISFVAGQLPWFFFIDNAPLSSQFAGLIIFILSAGAFLLVAHQITDIRWLQAMVWLFLGMSAVFISGRLFLSSWGRIILPFFPQGIAGSLFWVWLVALTGSQAMFNNKLRPVIRLGLLALLIATMYVAAIKTNDWKSGWVPPLVVLAILIYLRFPKSLPFMVIGGLFVFQDFFQGLITADQYSYDTRVEAWRIVLFEIVKVSPIVGLGPANYRFYTPLFPILGWQVQFNSHNNYVDLLAQTGVLGTGMFIWWAVTLGWLAWKLKDRVPQGFPRAYVLGGLAGLAATLFSGMLGDWVLPFVYNVGLKGFRQSVLAWLFLGGIVAIEQIYRQAKSPPAPPEKI